MKRLVLDGRSAAVALRAHPYRVLLSALMIFAVKDAVARPHHPHVALKAGTRRHAAPALAAAIKDILSGPSVGRAHWGISVVTAEGGPVYSLNEGEFFAPASNAKLFTTAAALGLLGPDFISRTNVVEQGTVDAQGHLAGTLRLVGTGDPSLSGRTYPYDGKTERAAAPLHVLDELAAQTAAALTAQGVRQVDGPVIGDDTFFPAERYGAGWEWDDLEWGYGAPVSALTINDNVVYLNIFPGGKLGDAAVVSWNPALPRRVLRGPESVGAVAAGGADAFYLTANSMVTGGVARPLQIGVDRVPGSRTVRLYGSIPLDSNGVHLALAIDDPAGFAASAFREMLMARGVKINGGVGAAEAEPGDTQSFEERIREPLGLRPLAAASGVVESGAAQSGAAQAGAVTGGTVSVAGGTATAGAEGGAAGTAGASGRGAVSLSFSLKPGEVILASHSSPTLGEEATVINKVSQNLHAELLLRELGKAETGDGSFAEGARVVRQFLVNAGVSGDDFVFYDGSGLSAKDMVTPRAMTTLLVYATRQPWGAAFRSTLPVGGTDGTLSLRFLQSPLRGKVFAKTGTLAEVNSIAGYLVAASGRTVVFSILCNGRRPGSDAERKAIDRIVEAIAAAN